MNQEQRVRVLVVEDSQPMREVIHEFLVGEGYDCDTAGSVEAALDLLRQVEYHVIVTDLRLPGLDGFALLERANDLQPLTPKIIVTAYSDVDDALRALRLGAYDFLRKPIRNLWELGVVIQRATEHRRLLVERENHLRKIEAMNDDLRRLNENLESEVDRRTEALIRANRELRTLDEMKNNLLANVSHELRTPLVSVRGYTELFASGRLCTIPDDCRKYLTTSLRNIDKLLTLIESLVSYAEMARGGVQLELSVVDMADLLQRVAGQVRAAAEERGIRVDVRLPEYPVSVNADASRLEEALRQVLDNAVKFNKQDGTITVALDPVGRRLVKVTVTDSGIGIGVEEQARIFERFYQVEGGATRHHGGTGMGLAIARDNLRLIGCELRVSSELGGGSTFYFTIPVVAGTENGGFGEMGGERG